MKVRNFPLGIGFINPTEEQAIQTVSRPFLSSRPNG